MSKVIFNVPEVSCQHCVASIKSAVEALEGVTSVTVDLAKKTAEIEYSIPADESQIKEAIEDTGFDVVK